MENSKSKQAFIVTGITMMGLSLVVVLFGRVEEAAVETADRTGRIQGGAER